MLSKFGEFQFFSMIVGVGISGAGPDGVEEIKRHSFFSTIDWNVSFFFFFFVK